MNYVEHFFYGLVLMPALIIFLNVAYAFLIFILNSRNKNKLLETPIGVTAWNFYVWKIPINIFLALCYFRFLGAILRHSRWYSDSKLEFYSSNQCISEHIDYQMSLFRDYRAEVSRLAFIFCCINIS